VTLLRDGNAVHDDAGLSGSEQDCLGTPGTVTYRLEARNRAGTMVSANASVQVSEAQPQTAVPPTAAVPTEAPAPPQISGFSANPPTVDVNNMCTTLSWSLSGSGIAKVTLYRNGAEIASDPQSPYEDCVDQSLEGTSIQYRLKADSEFGGSDEKEIYVQFTAG